MAIVLICSSCGKKMNVPDEYAGRKGQCSSCGAKLIVPVPKGMTVATAATPASAAPRPAKTATSPPKAGPAPLAPAAPKPSQVDPVDDGVAYGLSEDEMLDDHSSSSNSGLNSSEADDMFDDGEEAPPRSRRQRGEHSESRGGAKKKKKRKKRSNSQGGGVVVKIAIGLAVCAIVAAVIGGVVMFGKGFLNPMPSSWTVYTSSQGDFSIAMPTKPDNESQVNPFGGGPGQKMTTKIIQYGIAAEALPLGPLASSDKRQAAGFLKLFGPALITGLNAREISKKENVWVYGWPAIQVRLETSLLAKTNKGDPMVTEADLLCFSNGVSLYAVWVIHKGPSGSKRFASKIYEQPELVFETFKLTSESNKLVLETGDNHGATADIASVRADGFEMPDINALGGVPGMPTQQQPMIPPTPQAPSFPQSAPPGYPGSQQQQQGGMPGAQPGDPTILRGPGGGIVLPM